MQIPIQNFSYRRPSWCPRRKGGPFNQSRAPDFKRFSAAGFSPVCRSVSGSVQDRTRHPEVAGEQAPAQRDLHSAVVLPDQVRRGPGRVADCINPNVTGGPRVAAAQKPNEAPQRGAGDAVEAARTAPPSRVSASRPGSPPRHGRPARGARGGRAGGTAGRAPP